MTARRTGLVFFASRSQRRVAARGWVLRFQNFSRAGIPCEYFCWTRQRPPVGPRVPVQPYQRDDCTTGRRRGATVHQRALSHHRAFSSVGQQSSWFVTRGMNQSMNAPRPVFEHVRWGGGFQTSHGHFVGARLRTPGATGAMAAMTEVRDDAATCHTMRGPIPRHLRRPSRCIHARPRPARGREAARRRGHHHLSPRFFFSFAPFCVRLNAHTQKGETAQTAHARRGLVVAVFVARRADATGSRRRGRGRCDAFPPRRSDAPSGQ